MELVSPLYFNIVAVIAIIAGLGIAAWWIVALYWMHSREAEKKLPSVRLPEDLAEAPSGPPPVLIVFYAFMAVALIGYVLYIWIGGITY